MYRLGMVASDGVECKGSDWWYMADLTVKAKSGGKRMGMKVNG